MRPPRRRGCPAGSGSFATRPEKQAGKCVYKLFKLWINFSGVCVCVSPPVVIFQKSGLLEIFSLKLERNLNSLRAGGGGPGAAALAGAPRVSPRRATHGRGAQLRGRAAGGGRTAAPGLVCPRLGHLPRLPSIKVQQEGPGSRYIPGCCHRQARPLPALRHPHPTPTDTVFPGSPAGKGIPTR